MDKQYAIFDMDGTLIDSMGIWRNLGREYLTAKGVTDCLDEILEEIRPMTMTESAALFVSRFSLPESSDCVTEEMNQMMDTHYHKDIQLKAGVLSHLEQLRQRGVRMCVASATEERLMQVCLERLGVLSYFDFLISCESMGNSKREPDIYLESARRLKAAPEEIAVYEDALYAVQTAKKAGFYVIGVYDEEADHHWDEICNMADETINFD